LTPKKRLALAPINQQILDTSAKLDSYIKDFQPWTMPEIPYAYTNQNIWAFPAQLRQRNPGGRAIVLGAPVYIPPPIAKNDIGPMDKICIKCNARKFKGETDG
jgi:hypothetical protein